MFGVGIGPVSHFVLNLIVLHFPPLTVTTIPGSGETDSLQTLVSVATRSVLIRDTVAARYGMVTDVGGALQNHVAAASQTLS